MHDLCGDAVITVLRVAVMWSHDCDGNLLQMHALEITRETIMGTPHTKRDMVADGEEGENAGADGVGIVGNVELEISERGRVPEEDGAHAIVSVEGERQRLHLSGLSEAELKHFFELECGAAGER